MYCVLNSEGPLREVSLYSYIYAVTINNYALNNSYTHASRSLRIL